MFAWQGGEPTLCGINFRSRCSSVRKQYGEGKKIHNAFQTNGILLNDEWCQFLHDNGWLVGISLDGPAELHDAYRVNRSENRLTIRWWTPLPGSVSIRWSSICW